MASIDRRATWTPEHDALLRDEYGVTLTRDLARKLDKSETAVRVRASRMGLDARVFRSPYARESAAVGVEPRSFVRALQPHRGRFAPLLEAWR